MSIRNPEGKGQSPVLFCPLLRHTHTFTRTDAHTHAMHTHTHAHLETSFLGLHRPPIVIATALTWVLPPEVEDVPHTHP